MNITAKSANVSNNRAREMEFGLCDGRHNSTGLVEIPKISVAQDNIFFRTISFDRVQFPPENLAISTKETV